MHSSTSGNGYHGGLGASSRRARRLVGARARGVRGAAAGGSRRSLRRRGRTACGTGVPSGCQVANGQPEESLTCHQPQSMPMRPSRGRTVPDAAAALAEVGVRRCAPSGTCRARAACARAARRAASSRSARARQLGARAEPSLADSRSRRRSSSPNEQHAAGRRCAPGRARRRSPSRGKRRGQRVLKLDARDGRSAHADRAARRDRRCRRAAGAMTLSHGGSLPLVQ